MTRPAEQREIHTRLLKCDLVVDESRAWWGRSAEERAGTIRAVADRAFEQFWFGARSAPWARELVANLRARFDAFPPATRVLGDWSRAGMDAESRRLVCHWHLQLADPLYRQFTGEFLPERRDGPRPAGATAPSISRDQAILWVTAHGPDRWTLRTATQFATKLLSCAHAAGLLAEPRGRRTIQAPRVPDVALSYVFHLLRGVDFDGGDLRDNPYLRSVGLDGPVLDDRLRALPDLDFRSSHDLVDYGWAHADLDEWGASLR